MTSTFDFRPAANGVDFLDSAIMHLVSSQEPRSLKYAVLHLQAATEILVKVRLQREGMHLIFEDPASATEEDLKSGKFRSVGLNTALSRLNEEANVSLARRQKRAFDRLNVERNKLQHFGSTSNHEVVESVAGRALDGLLDFVNRHLLPNAPDEDAAQFGYAEQLIAWALREIEALFKARMERITPALDKLGEVVVGCPECTQLTYAPASEDRCLYCDHDWSSTGSHRIASEYAENVLDYSYHLAVKDREYWPVSLCPECDSESLVSDVTMRGADESANVCFSCVLVVSDGELDTCEGCGRTMFEQDGFMLCPDCFEYRVSKDD